MTNSYDNGFFHVTNTTDTGKYHTSCRPRVLHMFVLQVKIQYKLTKEYNSLMIGLIFPHEAFFQITGSVPCVASVALWLHDLV